MYDATILAPVCALVLWTLVMLLWLYALRIPALIRHRIKLDPKRPKAELADLLPPRVRWAADNHNHLTEQPTLFYATALALALLDLDAGLNTQIAWAYVGLRVVHSLVQATINVILIRFVLFVMASLCLLALAIHLALGLLHRAGYHLV